MIEYITLSDLVKKVSQDAVEKGKEIFNTKKIREKYLNIFEIIEKKFSQQNKVLGNIEKFAENQGLQTFFFKEKVSQNTAKYRNRFLKWSKFGVKIERKWSKYFKKTLEE